jgi:hypothetical protein
MDSVKLVFFLPDPYNQNANINFISSLTSLKTINITLADPGGRAV